MGRKCEGGASPSRIQAGILSRDAISGGGASWSERGVRLAQKMQVGPCIPVGNTSNTAVTCKRLKLAQVLGQLGVFLTTPRAAASPHAVTSTSKISATPHAGLRRPRTQSRPGQGSVQHPGQDCGVPTRSHSRLNAQCKHVRKVSGWPKRCKSAHVFS